MTREEPELLTDIRDFERQVPLVVTVQCGLNARSLKSMLPPNFRDSGKTKFYYAQIQCVDVQMRITKVSVRAEQSILSSYCLLFVFSLITPLW